MTCNDFFHVCEHPRSITSFFVVAHRHHVVRGTVYYRSCLLEVVSVLACFVAVVVVMDVALGDRDG